MFYKKIPDIRVNLIRIALYILHSLLGTSTTQYQQKIYVQAVYPTIVSNCSPCCQLGIHIGCGFSLKIPVCPVSFAYYPIGPEAMLSL